MKKEIAIAITALMVATLVAPAVMAADVDYTVSVSSCNTVVTQIDTAFGSIIPGNSSELSPSIELNNTGSANCNVDAKFTTGTATDHGLVSGSNVIPALNFEIGTNNSEVPLNNDGSDKYLGVDNQVPANDFVNYDAKLAVPGAQAGGIYTGTVQLTFTAV